MNIGLMNWGWKFSKGDDKRWFEVKEEQIKIRDELNQVINILNNHTVLLERLPDAIKEKIGFKA